MKVGTGDKYLKEKNKKATPEVSDNWGLKTLDFSTSHENNLEILEEREVDFIVKTEQRFKGDKLVMDIIFFTLLSICLATPPTIC